jgi:sulfur relay (sulfurtransferase) DsrF/TusC family protein
MTSKERLDIIKQRVNTIRLNAKIGSRRIADEENAVLLDSIDYNLNKLCEPIERDTPKYLKQEKLLSLYKELSNYVDEDSYAHKLPEITRLKILIKELENEFT